MKTYISLFSSAGVGCYGFKQAGFECIATNEIIERRLNVQKFNHKCKYDTGYICDDIKKEETKQKLYQEVRFWKKQEHIKNVDVIIATPPCQGMSVANLKKNDGDKQRNSLVVESIKIIKEIKPNFFIFENVPAFLKTACTDIDGVDKSIADAIESNLGENYLFFGKVINFKNYGACSSRQRTLVIGVSKKYEYEISPLELFPDMQPVLTLREVIGHLKPLVNFGEIDENDIYHQFRLYPQEMRSWIHGLKEGESAFDNKDIMLKPHQLVDGIVVVNKQKNGDKYTRQYWDKVGPCIHTRNDQLASQNTIHPSDDRVFSIREIMLMMTVPFDFKWSEYELDTLNNFSLEEKRKYLKKEEIKIRQSLGEAVPTIIFKAIADKISAALEYSPLSLKEISKIVNNYKLVEKDALYKFIIENRSKYSPSALGRISEIANTNRTNEGAYFTSKPIISEMVSRLPEFDKNEIRILEPSVGVGNFIPLLVKKYSNKKVTLDVLDIDRSSLDILKLLISLYNIPAQWKVHYINDDFLTHQFDVHYDLIIGNPPFFKINSKDKKLNQYRKQAINKNTANICSFFLDKAVSISDYVSFVFPKFLLNTPEFNDTRKYLSKKTIDYIVDFGEKWFPGVLIETIAIQINNKSKNNIIDIVSVPQRIKIRQNKNYIFDNKLPYWILYRNNEFDELTKKIELDCFDVFRDRQITNSILRETGDIRVLKSRNISMDGGSIIDIKGYDSYVSRENAISLEVFKFLDNENVYLVPNMTYYPRILKKPKGVIVNGSVAILIPKKMIIPSERQLKFLCSNSFRKYYQIARNYQTRSLNIDSVSVKFFGLLKED